MLVANVEDNATAKSLTDVILVFAVPILVAIVADKATAKSLTEVIRVLAVPILVAIVADSAVIAVLLLLILVASVADTAASSASVTNPVPSPITPLIDVIAAKFTDVSADTAAITVLLLPILVAIVADRATA
jgi:putative effector of murein hydrolase LrgA (UPF0299 family)